MNNLQRKAFRLLREACRYRDNLYREEERRWTKASEMFEDAVLALLDADERHFAELSQVFIKHCYEKSKKFPCCLGRHRHQN